jgi:hypothetical protein
LCTTRRNLKEHQQPQRQNQHQLLRNLASFRPSKESKGSTLIKKLQAFQKEPTVRFTVDLPESLHRKLSAAATKAGYKKVDIVRMFLEERLKDFNDNC